MPRWDDETPMECEEKSDYPLSAWDHCWVARQRMFRPLDLLELCREVDGAPSLMRGAIALAQERIRDLDNALKLLEQEVVEEEARLQSPPSAW